MLENNNSIGIKLVWYHDHKNIDCAVERKRGIQKTLTYKFFYNLSLSAIVYKNAGNVAL